jgi:hypothetical protein
MEMHFFWISDKCAQEMYALHWHPGQENLVDYQSKQHTGAHHAAVCPWYLHEPNSPLLLPRAKALSALKGCVGTLDDGYLCKVSLPRAPGMQSPGHMTCAAVTEHVKSDTCYSQVPGILTWSDLVQLQLGGSRSAMLPLAPRWLM